MIFTSSSALSIDNILEAIKDAILITDANGRICFLNSAYCRMRGVKREEALGRRIEEVRPAPLVIPTVLSTGRAIHGIRKKKGEDEYISDVIPILADGRVVGVVSVTRGVREVCKLIEEYQNSATSVTKYEGQDCAQEMFAGIVCASAGFKSIIESARKIARTDSTVLIRGETGTGKELIAKAIHAASKRSRGYFVAVNCAAMPAELLESELFGYAPGAFTGASRQEKIGLFELADKGTIFLDEIGDMNPYLQAKILRVLEEQVLRKLGSTKERRIDVRVIAATNKDLEQLMDEGLFRADLFYRLNVVPVRIPPLRERRQDIVVIAQYYLEQLNKKYRRELQFAPSALQELTNHDWPGNVRELKNVVEYAVNIVEDGRIASGHLPIGACAQGAAQVGSDQIGQAVGGGLRRFRADLETQAIFDYLQVYGHSTAGKRQAAAALGISLATLYRKIKALQQK